MAQTWHSRSTWFGDVALLLFLLMQCLDGVFTYVGVVTLGPRIEANPVVGHLMGIFGTGAALTATKVLASSLGIVLHLRQVHLTVLLLSAFYLAAAVGPWLAVLYF